MRYYKVSVDDHRDRIIVRVEAVSKHAIGGRVVNRDGTPQGNMFALFGPEDIKYEMVLDRSTNQLERLGV